MSDLIVKVAVKDIWSDQNVSAGFYDATQRDEANDRKMVRPREL